MPNCIPIRLSLADICVSALMEAADGLEEARDVAAFLDALENSRHLWLAVREACAKSGWAVPSPSDAEFIVHCSSRLGRGVTDADIDAMVAIKRRVARELAANNDIARIRTRARLAYREDGSGGFNSWLVSQMNKTHRLQALAFSAIETSPGRPVIGISAST